MPFTYLIAGEGAGRTLESLTSGLAFVCTTLDEGQELVRSSSGAGRTLGATTINGVEYSVIVGPPGESEGWVACLDEACRLLSGTVAFVRGGAKLFPRYEEAVSSAFGPRVGAVYGDRYERGVRRFSAPFVWERLLSQPRVEQTLAVSAGLVTAATRSPWWPPPPGLLLPLLLFDISRHHLVCHVPESLSAEPPTPTLDDAVRVDWNACLGKLT